MHKIEDLHSEDCYFTLIDESVIEFRIIKGSVIINMVDSVPWNTLDEFTLYKFKRLIRSSSTCLRCDRKLMKMRFIGFSVACSLLCECGGWGSVYNAN